MLSNSKFIRQSLELHLFFARIMKEHSFFLEIGFTPKNSNYAAIVVEIKTLVPLTNCDNVQHAIILGNAVVVSTEVKIGDIGIVSSLSAKDCRVLVPGRNDLGNWSDLDQIELSSLEAYNAKYNITNKSKSD